jgi:Zn-dependent protease with chaperone function
MEAGQVSPASRERRQVAAFIDIVVVFGSCFILSWIAHLANWQFWIAFAVIWFLVEVPPVATRGRSIGHLVTSTRLIATGSDRAPGWRRAFVRWLVLVPGVASNRFGAKFRHDGWSDTSVVLDPYGPAWAYPLREGLGEDNVPIDPRWRARAQALEQLALEHPRRYRTQLALIAAGGYAFLVLVAIVQFGIAAVLVIHALDGGAAMGYVSGLVLAVLGLTTLSTLWLERSLPPGMPVTRDEAPELFGTIDELRRRLDAPRIHVIVLDPMANAGLLQQPRFGPFGPYRNVLVVGVTLMRALAVDEMRVILAHEIAHLERRHGRVSAWVYRLRQAYPRLLEHCEHKGWTAIAAQLFFERYTPYFDLWSLALARTHEFEADELAASVAGPQTFAAALQRSELVWRLLDEKLEVPSEEPPEEAAYHPSHERRLAAVGAKRTPLPPVDVTAARALIPKDLDDELIDLFELIEMAADLEAEDESVEPTLTH